MKKAASTMLLIGTLFFVIVITLMYILGENRIALGLGLLLLSGIYLLVGIKLKNKAELFYRMVMYVSSACAFVLAWIRILNKW